MAVYCSGKKTEPNIHEEAAACLEKYVEQKCDEVCSTCHSDQSISSFAITVDGEFPGLFPADGTEDPWSDLPQEHRACRDCHSAYAENEGNHPIFVRPKDSSFFEEETTGVLKYYDGQILCATCHDPHSAALGLLRMENTGSALCLECHSR